MASEEQKAQTEQSTDSKSVSCKGCGTTIWAVSEDELDRLFASHMLKKHSDEAPTPVLDEAREILEEFE